MPLPSDLVIIKYTFLQQMPTIGVFRDTAPPPPPLVHQPTIYSQAASQKTDPLIKIYSLNDWSCMVTRMMPV